MGKLSDAAEQCAALLDSGQMPKCVGDFIVEKGKHIDGLEERAKLDTEIMEGLQIEVDSLRAQLSERDAALKKIATNDGYDGLIMSAGLARWVAREAIGLSHEGTKTPPESFAIEEENRRLHEQLSEQSAQLAVAVAVLAELEWAGQDNRGGEGYVPACPQCGSHQQWAGHQVDCALAAALSALTRLEAKL